MGDNTKIEWADATWNPIRARNKETAKLGWHCVHKNAACINCYSEDKNKWVGTGLPFKPGHEKDIEIFFDDNFQQPLRWQRSRKIFVCSMTDLFGEFVTDHMIDKVFAMAIDAPQHTYQILTKRPARMREYIRLVPERRKTFDCHSAFDFAQWPPRNVWLGVTAHDQASADEFVPQLLDTPAAVRFVSYEPALGPVDWSKFFYVGPEGGWEYWGDRRQMIHQLICGGESGPRARPMLRAWARSARDQCKAANVAYFFKQWGQWIDADEFTANTGTPLNYEQAEAEAKLQGCRFEHFSDGSTMLRMTKKQDAGRLLDGVYHNGFPDSMRFFMTGRS